MYAYAQAYSYYSGLSLSITTEDINGGPAAISKVKAAFVGLIVASTADGKAATYFGIDDVSNPTVVTGTRAETDARTVVSSMGAVNSASDVLLKNISSADCFSSTGSTANTVDAFLAAAAEMNEGDILILITADGAIVVDPTEASN